MRSATSRADLRVPKVSWLCRVTVRIEPRPRVAPVGAGLPGPGRHQRVRGLHQQGPGAAEQRGHLPVDPPHHRVRPEQPVVVHAANLTDAWLADDTRAGWRPGPACNLAGCLRPSRCPSSTSGTATSMPWMQSTSPSGGRGLLPARPQRGGQVDHRRDPRGAPAPQLRRGVGARLRSPDRGTPVPGADRDRAPAAGDRGRAHGAGGLELYGSMFPNRRDPDELIDLVGLHPKAGRRIRTLSGRPAPTTRAGAWGWRAIPMCCSSTSPPPGSTRRPAVRRGRWWRGSPGWGRRLCSPPTTWTRRSTSPTGWR